MTRRKAAPVLLVLISLVLISSFLISPYSTSQVKSVPLDVKPQTHYAPPSSQTGSGNAMSLAEFVYAWQFNKTVKANNTLSGYQQRNAPSFSEPTPPPYTKLLQNLTVSNLTASQDVREVQYASGSASSLTANDTGFGTYAQVAMKFGSVDRANLTGVWLYYTSAKVANLNIVNSSVNPSDKTPSGRPTIATYVLPVASIGWHKVNFNNMVTLQAGFYYWIVVNATGSGGAQVTWYYITDAGGGTTEDSKYAAVYSGGWLNEANIHSFYPYLNLMLMLDVLPVNPADASKVRTYNSPLQVAMNETNSNTQLLSNRTSIPVGYSAFALRANTSVTMAVNWTASFRLLQLSAVSTHYVAQEGFTQWTVNFTSGSKPNPTAYPYTWINRNFIVTVIPQFWNGSAPPPSIWNNRSYSPSPSFFFAPGSYTIFQMNNLTTDPWNAKWGISAKSTYAVTASMPPEVVVGLPITLNVSTAPYSPSLCNVSFYTGSPRIFSRNVSIPFPSTSVLVPLRFNETGTHNLYLFDQSNDSLNGYEVSLSRMRTIEVLPADCNVTVTGRTSPVIGNVGALKFKFFNNTLGNVVIPPLAVSVNGTPTTNFVYDPSSHNTTVFLNTASSGWRTGNNTLMVSAKSGVYNATEQTWIVVQRPLSNVTVVSVNQPFLGGTASLSVEFFNKTLGATPVLIDPASVKINGTSTSFTYSSGVVTTTWSTATGGWHLGLNHVNVSTTKGIFSNSTVTTLTIIQPLSNVTVVSVSSPILGNPATAQFKFLNGTNSWLSMPPISVEINGTDPLMISYASGITTVTWNTLSGGWRAGPHYVSITAISGVFFNSTVYPFMIIAPDAKLLLNATGYPATYGDRVSVGLSFLNITGGGTPFPSPPTLYRNGTAVSVSSDGLGGYVYVLDTHIFAKAGNFHLNFTAVYGTFVAGNLTSVAVAPIPMRLSVSSGQTSVNVGSSYSVKANLTYTSGAPAPDGCTIRFVFSVTYANGSVPIVVYGTTTDGLAEASLLATSGMQSVAVEAFYDGSLTLGTANYSAASIRVTVATGLPIPVLLGIGVGGALVVIIPLAVIVKRRRSKETETRKTSVLRQTASLAQLIVVHLASGRSLFSRTIGSEEGADPNLISGFLSANQALIGEVFKRQTGAGLKFADYGDYKVISDLGRHVMVTLFATETAGRELKDVLQSFTEKFEKKYAKDLESWDGDMNTFRDADALADEVFCLPLTAPYMLLENTSAKLGKVERMAVHSAKIISAERGVFFMPRVIDYLLTKQGIKRGKAMDVINSLTDKGIFRQLTVEQAAQVIKSCAEKAGTQQ